MNKLTQILLIILFIFTAFAICKLFYSYTIGNHERRIKDLEFLLESQKVHEDVCSKANIKQRSVNPEEFHIL